MKNTIKLVTIVSIAIQPVFAQEVDSQAVADEIVVVGSHIKGSQIADILPVTVLDNQYIELTGATSGDELLAAIPEMGTVTFREGRFSGINGARGDVGSVNLRDVGTGSTLVLLNGRRLVLHPGTQVENFVPVQSINTNALPVTGVKRMEVLRDGASAIYGTDAVAGVVNTILQDDYEGFTGEIRHGKSSGKSLTETSAVFKWGQNFNNGNTNISVFANLFSRDGMPATEVRNSAQEDLRPLYVGTPFEGDTQLRNLSTQTQFAEFKADSSLAALDDDDFHIQPVANAGCLVTLQRSSGVCADNGGSIDTSLRLDRARYRDIVGDTDRQNIFAFANHQLENDMELFAEFSYYHADYSRLRETAAILSSNRFYVPAESFYNEFGVDLKIMDYRPIDTGQRHVNVKNDSYRVLAGLRGELNGWDWETAVFQTQAETKDRTNRISNTLFQQALARTTADAYNIFSGGNVTDTDAPNFANQQATIDSFMVDVKRDSQTTLRSVDVKFSSPSVFSVPAGDVGVAVGAEFRQEEFKDDRDDRLDGTTTFTDMVSGIENLSDVMGSSPSPDTNGKRDVTSAYVEFAIPLLNEAMDIPLVYSLDMQLAARAEYFDDVGDVVKPKVALSWFPHHRFQIRGAYSEGFRAPNLEQIHAEGVRRVNTGREDWILCHNAAGGPTFANDDACDSVSVESVRSGGTNLSPETNENFSLGFTFEPFDNLTLTYDLWQIEQTDVIGLFGDQNQISLDYLMRLQGSSNPNVVRNATNDGTVGDIIEVRDPYTNLLPREIEGYDIGVYYQHETNRFGNFDFTLNRAWLDKYFQEPSSQGKMLMNAIADGTISDLVSVSAAESLIRQNGRPQWRMTASLRWNYENWGAGAFYKHIDDVEDTSTKQNDTGENLPVASFSTLNLYADYTFETFDNNNTRLRIGVNNVGDKDAPLADEFARGSFVGLHSNRGRHIYAKIRKKF